MLSFTNIIYYLLFLSATVLSLLAPKDNFRGLNYLRILLIVGLCSEVLIDLINYYYYSAVHNPPSPIHYLYIPFEYLMLSLFLKIHIRIKRIRSLINFSFVIYIFTVLYLSIFYYSMENDYPGIIYNLGCGFLIIWSSLLLFNLEFNAQLKLAQLPVFWVCTAMIIFYSGVFFYNCYYNYFLKKETEFALLLRQYVNLNLNFIFYILLCYSFICSMRQKKSKMSTKSSIR